MTGISLIVRCHNEEAHIGRLLTGVAHQTRQPDEILLVDSGSTDATLAIASAFPVTPLRIPPEEFSFGRALNHGLAAATGDIAIFASAHVYPVYSNWLELLTAPFKRDEVALSYGRQQAPQSGRFSEQQLLATWFPGKSVERQLDPFCNNANAAIRRALWCDLPYDEQLTGLEDIDWAKRVLMRGHVLTYVAEAAVIHVHDESFGQVINRYRREAIAHKQIYEEQRMSLLTASWLAAKNMVGDAREALGEGVLQHHIADISRFRIAQFYGTYRGFRQSGPVSELLRRRFYYPSEAGRDVPADATGHLIDYEESLPGR